MPNEASGKGPCNGLLSRASAGNVRIHISPLGAEKEAKPPLSRACPGGIDTFHPPQASRLNCQSMPNLSVSIP